jgi:uncharacterized protein (DUF1697 family)
MNTCVAFLRGINVGGNNKINMPDLRKAFEGMGFASVSTYINSGNVIFQSDKTKDEIEKNIKDGLVEKLNYTLKTLIRSKEEIEDTVKHFPKVFSDANWKHNIIFLGNSINTPEILNKFVLKEDIEQNSYSEGVLFWSAKWEYGTRSTMLKLSTRPEYQEMTVRSIGTVRKILELMEKASEAK